MAYIVSDEYTQEIYSGGAKNKLTLKFNGIELENAGRYVENIKGNFNVLPIGNKRFSLDNLISKELTMVIHDIDTNVLVNPVEISIGTLVGESYEEVPIGIFQINDVPKTDNNKTTIKLRCYSTKLDVPYNAKPLMDGNDGKATLKQILQDICTQCGIELGTTTFTNENELIGTYDNTINARVYVAYIGEQAGCVSTIGRDGKLYLIPLNNSLTTHTINKDIVESFIDGEDYEISRVVYEDGARKFEFGDETKDTLYINASNPFINSESQIENIYNQINGFKISSFKTGKILGNPSIDPYDFIEIEYQGKTYKTLAQNTLNFGGTMVQNFDTQIGLEAKKENVTIKNDTVFKKTIKAEMDNLNGEFIITAESVENVTTKVTNLEIKQDNDKAELEETMKNDYATKQNVETVKNTVNQVITAQGIFNTFKETIEEDGVVKLDTTTGIKMNADGITIDVNSSSVKSIIDEKAIKIIDKNTNELKSYNGYVDEEVILERPELYQYENETINYNKNLIFEDWLSSKHFRLEEFEEDGETFLGFFNTGE